MLLPRFAACALLLVLPALCRVSPAAAAPPARIVSVGGAVTETVFALGAGDRVVGVDTSSVYPAAALKRPKVGYQRTLSAEGVLGLRPDLVLAAEEAGPAAAIELLRATGIALRVIAVPPGAAGARERIRLIAAALGLQQQGVVLLARLDREMAEAAALRARAKGAPLVLSLYARGGGVLLVPGVATPADEMLRLAGARNAVTAYAGIRPLSPEAVVAAAPEVVLVPERGLASLGGEADLWRLPGLQLTPAGRARRLVVLDDLLLLGFGPRTGEAVQLLLRALHPDLGP